MKNLLLLSLVLLAFSSCKKEEVVIEVPAKTSDIIGTWEHSKSYCGENLGSQLNQDWVVEFTSRSAYNVDRYRFNEQWFDYSLSENGQILSDEQLEFDWVLRERGDELVLIRPNESCSNGELRYIFTRM